MNVTSFVAMSGLLFLSACSGTDQGTQTMKVKVIDGQGQAMANVAVVIGTEAGTLTSWRTTNIFGEVYVTAPPPNATVTAARSCYSTAGTRTYYYLDTTYRANAPAVTLTLGTCVQDSRELTMHATDALAGIAFDEITLGALTYGGPDAVMGTDYALQDDGAISVVATGYDAGGGILGYGVALDRPAVDGSTVEVAIDRTELLQHTHTFAHVPSNVLSYFAFCSLIRKHAPTNLPYNFLYDVAPLPATVTTYSTGDFSDNFLFGASVTLDRDSDGTADAEVGLQRYLSRAAGQVFDFGEAPAIPTALAYQQGTSGRPTISWSAVPSLSTVQQLTLSYRTNLPERVSFSHRFSVPASATSLVFPELPDTLSVFRPAAYDTLALVTTKFASQSSYDHYLDAVANYNGRFYDAAGLNSYAYTSISRQP